MPETFAPAWEPTLDGYTDTRSAQVRRAQFEGGYSQRSATGPNSVARALALVWEVEDTQSAYILGFLEARRGVEAFLYQTPWDDAPVLWTCQEWDRLPIGKSRGQTMWRLRTRFIQEFDLI